MRQNSSLFLVALMHTYEHIIAQKSLHQSRPVWISLHKSMCTWTEVQSLPSLIQSIKLRHAVVRILQEPCTVFNTRVKFTEFHFSHPIVNPICPYLYILAKICNYKSRSTSHMWLAWTRIIRYNMDRVKTSVIQANLLNLLNFKLFSLKC